MRTHGTQWVLVVVTTMALAGCYSNGQWSAPNLAFWKSSPFQSDPNRDAAAPGAVGSPTKPAGIAAGATTTTTPSPGYYGSTAPTAPTTSLGSSNTLPTGYPTQYPYPATPSGDTAAATGGGYGQTPYTATTWAVPGGRAYGSQPNADAAQS